MDYYKLNPNSDKSDWEVPINYKQEYKIRRQDENGITIIEKKGALMCLTPWHMTENFFKKHFIKSAVTNWKERLKK